MSQPDNSPTDAEEPLLSPYAPNVEDYRTRIIDILGVGKRPETGLETLTLNHVYAYLTGEVYLPLHVMQRPTHPDHVTRQELCYAVVTEIDTRDPNGDWADPDSCPEQLRIRDLYTLTNQLEATDDHRPDGMILEDFPDVRG
jgi:hypothetical protein